MESIARVLKESGLLDKDGPTLEAFKREGPRLISGGEARLYRRSLFLREGILFFIAAAGGEKNLYLAAEKHFGPRFSGTSARIGGVSILKADWSNDNARRLHDDFPFTAPVSLRNKKTTVGCGDRLGLATPGHVRAVEKFDVFPVLAQQSMRELALTGRDYPAVVRDATFLVFQEGYRRGYGADGDHLKSIADIDSALSAGMPMITLDLSDVLSTQPAQWSAAKIDEEFERLDARIQGRVLSKYANKTFRPAGSAVEIGATEAKRCALMYGKAIDFAREVDLHLRTKRGDQYDLEISIDETTTPTLPAHHLFISSELALGGVKPSSLAPRFIGEFQKGIDYIGDAAEFEKQFAAHCDVAKAFGGYKISIHSGSDKFSVYPVIGKRTGMRLHLKTAGTSWLQALRVVARVNPVLFRSMLAKAIGSFADASKLYHVDADPASVPDAAGLKDSELERFLEPKDSRQILHITYGGLLSDPRIRAGLFRTLAENEELHYATVEEHIERHVRLLGAPQLD